MRTLMQQLTTARSILSMPDRTPKERLAMAEIRDTMPGGRIDWAGTVRTCHFDDGSALMMTLDSDFSPTEFLTIDPENFDEAIKHAIRCIECSKGWGEDELSNNIESNFPDLTEDQCDDIASAVLESGGGVA